MKIILVAGGSGGHIYPCLELAKYFKNNGHDILMCGCKDSMEERIYTSNNLDFIGLNINKNKVKTYFKTKKEIEKIYTKYKPDALVLFGNYISFSFAVSAIKFKIPIYLHEQNVIYGNANKLIGLWAKKIYLSMPIAFNFYKKKSLLVGNPKSDVDVYGYQYKKNKNIVIAMGSLGSTTINNLIKEFIHLVDSDFEYHIVVGKKYYDDFIKKNNFKTNVHIYPFLDNLASYIKTCDIFISRAGATTISEIVKNQVPSILIPSPYVKNNHQYKNAKYLFDNKASLLLEEKKINANILHNEIKELLNDSKKRKTMQENLSKLLISNSKRKIYEDILKDYGK